MQSCWRQALGDTGYLHVLTPLKPGCNLGSQPSMDLMRPPMVVTMVTKARGVPGFLPRPLYLPPSFSCLKVQATGYSVHSRTPHSFALCFNSLRL